MNLFEKFSSRENLKQAFKYLKNELKHSSLSISPINHPALTAIDAIGDQFFIALEKYIRDGKYTPERGFFVYIAKDNLGLRPVCVLSMIDRIVYQAILNQDILGFKLDGQLSDKVCFAHRVNDDKNSEYFLSLYFNGWDAFHKAQEKAFNNDYTWKAEFDIQQYYENIPARKLIKLLNQDFGIRDEKILGLLEKQLTTWIEYPDLPKGIPQGPNASSLLGNIYLSLLDRFAENELTEKGIRYFRYVDDIVIMGQKKEDVLKATEEIVHFLRDYHLNLNEKTHVKKLENTTTIKAMRIFSDYDDIITEIPRDEFSRIEGTIPDIMKKITNGENVDKPELRDFKYYLRIATNYDIAFLVSLIEIIPLRPSLVVPIVRYITEALEYIRTFENLIEIEILSDSIENIYYKSEMSEWSKFWIFKLIVSDKDLMAKSIGREIKKILASQGITIFKVVALYHEAMKRNEIEFDFVNRLVLESKNDIEKSLFSFFFLNTFKNARASTVLNCIEKSLNANSHERNLIGCYLYQSNPQIKIDDVDGVFSSYILNKKQPKKDAGENQHPVSPENYYLVSGNNLLPVASPSSLFGMQRPKRYRNSLDLIFPELVCFNKVTIKIKEGMREIEIFYNGKYIEKADYVKLEFYTGEKQQKPNRSWGFLCALSVLSATDIRQATPEKMRSMIAIDTKTTLSTTNVHQIKRTLVKRLREIFKTDDNPFDDDNREYYKPVFSIIPEPALRLEELRPQGGRLNENINYE